MKKIEIEVFRFSELDSEAKRVVKDRYAENHDYPWSKEALASLKELAKWAGGGVADYGVSWDASARSWCRFVPPEDGDWDIAEIREKARGQLGTCEENGRGLGDCALTGYCADEDAIDGFRWALGEGETEFDALMQAAFDSWLAACQADYASFFEDGYFSEHCDGNNRWFLRSGKPAPV